MPRLNRKPIRDRKLAQVNQSYIARGEEPVLKAYRFKTEAARAKELEGHEDYRRDQNKVKARREQVEAKGITGPEVYDDKELSKLIWRANTNFIHAMRQAYNLEHGLPPPVRTDPPDPPPDPPSIARAKAAKAQTPPIFKTKRRDRPF